MVCRKCRNYSGWPGDSTGLNSAPSPNQELREACRRCCGIRIRSRTQFQHLPLDKYFRHAEVATFRGDWKNSNAVFVGFKAGNNRASHGHLDLGSFVLDAQGERWALDLGSDNYNLPGYFGKQRSTYYRLRAEGHNTLVFNNGDPGPDQNLDAKTQIVRFESKPRRAFAIADLTPAYSKSAQSVRRGIALLNRSDVLIQDEIDAKPPGEFWWFMHTPAKIKLDGSSAILTLGKKQMHARILSPVGATFIALKAEPLPDSPHPEGQADDSHISKLAVHFKDAQHVRLAILISEDDADNDADLKIAPL